MKNLTSLLVFSAITAHCFAQQSVSIGLSPEVISLYNGENYNFFERQTLLHSVDHHPIPQISFHTALHTGDSYLDYLETAEITRSSVSGCNLYMVVLISDWTGLLRTEFVSILCTDDQANKTPDTLLESESSSMQKMENINHRLVPLE